MGQSFISLHYVYKYRTLLVANQRDLWEKACQYVNCQFQTKTDIWQYVSPDINY